MTNQPQRPEVAVVIISYNSADVIGDLLAGLPAACEGVRHRIVVVDNGSRDTTVQIVEDWPGVEVVKTRNGGYSWGINRGVEAVPEAESFLILNPDVRMSPGSVARLLHRMRVTGAGLVVPRVDNWDGSPSLCLRRSPSLLRASGLGFTKLPAFSEYVHEPAAYAYAHVVDWAVGAAMLVAKGCYDDLGGWDESYFLYSEETDFCLRAADRGWPVYYEPQATALHMGGASGRSERTDAMQLVNRVRLYRRRHRTPAAVCYFALTAAREGLRLAKGSQPSKEPLLALLRPSRRPKEIGCDTLLPR